MNFGAGGLPTSLTTELALESLRRGCPVRMRITTGSMRPLLPPGMVVVVGPPNDICVGDVVVRQYGDGLPVVHRLLERYSDGGVEWLRTRGDAAASADAPWPIEQAVGVVTYIICDDREISAISPTARTINQFIAFCSQRFGGYLVRLRHSLPRWRTVYPARTKGNSVANEETPVS